MICPDFEKLIVIIEETLSKEINIRDTIEATRRELKTQLRKSTVELTADKKIQARIEETLVVANEEVKYLVALLMKD